ncbi:phage portal protein [Roseospira marina]|uniref:Phage portal protein n=1 Tax=Roseospira marina TaxID=140057 RepID=A0A5M6I484_9PROT|nr:phage portal protein [Roseospira marina]MBB4313022.1 hypothetical protein [Roseospira marina]MBB5089285.1 hypothetical protein [Roseospira marina]
MTIINADGSPMKAAAQASVTAYQAADPISQDLAGWAPALGSADADLLPERVDIVARIRDLVRNNGWASGAVRRELDTVIGAGLRLSSKPDYRALGLSADWAAEWSDQVEAQFRLWADDPARWCDATRHYTLGGLFGMAYRHYVIDGDALAVLQWRDHGAGFATTVRVIDPDRLSNPHDTMDTETLRAGVELDGWGAATAYHIRKRHPGDWFTGGRDAYAWERIPRETPWGRPVTVHFYDKERDEQSRGVGRTPRRRGRRYPAGSPPSDHPAQGVHGRRDSGHGHGDGGGRGLSQGRRRLRARPGPDSGQDRRGPLGRRRRGPDPGPGGQRGPDSGEIRPAGDRGHVLAQGLDAVPRP